MLALMEKKKLVTIDVVALGRAGGTKRAENLSAKRRSEIARKAAEARWKDKATK
jgi:hypothetical protein